MEGRVCSICGEPLIGRGYSADPLTDGLCCEACLPEVWEARQRARKDLIGVTARFADAILEEHGFEEQE